MDTREHPETVSSRLERDGRIVVGWSDSPEGRACLAWAVQQALLTGRSVLVLHEVQRDPLGGGTGRRGPYPMPEKSRAALEGTVRRLGERFQDLDLRIAVEVDEPVAGLVRWSATADLLVLGAPSDPHPRMMGALTDHVAAAADSPVAWIRGGWQSNAETDRLVVVGATSTPAGRAAVRFAASEAGRMGSNLVALVGAVRGTADGRTILSCLEEVAVARPQLMLQVHWIGTDPARALIDASRRAQLLVVGTHHSADRWSIRLGPVTESVLRGAHCPVVTVARVHVSAADPPSGGCPPAAGFRTRSIRQHHL